MNEKEFIEKIEEIVELDAGTLHGDEQLIDLEGWDSLAVMSFIAMVDSELNTTLEAVKITSSQTVNDLVQLVHEKLTDV